MVSKFYCPYSNSNTTPATINWSFKIRGNSREEISVSSSVVALHKDQHCIDLLYADRNSKLVVPKGK
jgi:hypothetical protein